MPPLPIVKASQPAVKRTARMARMVERKETILSSWLLLHLVLARRRSEEVVRLIGCYRQSVVSFEISKAWFSSAGLSAIVNANLRAQPPARRPRPVAPASVHIGLASSFQKREKLGLATYIVFVM